MQMMWASLGLGNDQGQLFAERGSSQGPLVPGEVFSRQDRAKREDRGLGTAIFSCRILQNPELQFRTWPFQINFFVKLNFRMCFP